METPRHCEGFTYAEQIRPADVQPVLDMLERYGVLKNNMPTCQFRSPGHT
jgi:hypothetical protein